MSTLSSQTSDHRRYESEHVCFDAATEEAATRPGSSRSVRHGRQSNQSQQLLLPVQGTRRSQRQLQQQQQRQLKEKQVQAEQQHTSRIRTQVSTAVAIATPSNRHSATRTTSCTVFSRSQTRQTSADVQPAESNENEMQQQQQPVYQQGRAQGNAGKAAASNGAIGRKGKSSPTAGIKKQTSPVGKGSHGGLALGARFPLRVRKNAEQPSMKSELNSKFVQACQNRGLGDLACHQITNKAV